MNNLEIDIDPLESNGNLDKIRNESVEPDDIKDGETPILNDEERHSKQKNLFSVSSKLDHFQLQQEPTGNSCSISCIPVP